MSTQDTNALAPSRYSLLGYLYVVEFDSGRIKVGQSRDARRRIAQHEGHARRFGSSMTRTWVSPPHLEYRRSESSMIRLCSSVASAASGSEYFDVSFDRAVELACSLQIAQSSPEEVAAAEAELERKGEAFIGLVMKTMGAPAGPPHRGQEAPPVDEALPVSSAYSWSLEESLAAMAARDGDWVGQVDGRGGDDLGEDHHDDCRCQDCYSAPAERCSPVMTFGARQMDVRIFGGATMRVNIPRRSRAHREPWTTDLYVFQEVLAEVAAAVDRLVAQAEAEFWMDPEPDLPESTHA